MPSSTCLLLTDFLDDGYKALRDLVMDYAGITPNSLIHSTDSIAPSPAIQHPRTNVMKQQELAGAVRESMQTFSEGSTTRSSSSQQQNGETTTVEETTATTTTTADTSAVSSNVQEETARLLSQYREVPHGQAQPPIKNIQSVARSWSRPSTSMSQYSTNSQSRAVAGSGKVGWLWHVCAHVLYIVCVTCGIMCYVCMCVCMHAMCMFSCACVVWCV